MDKSRKYLSDILIAIDLIEDFIIDISDFNDYEKDLKTINLKKSLQISASKMINE